MTNKNKRYKLIKDLPTFNVGDTFYLNNSGDLVLEYNRQVDWREKVYAYSAKTLERFPTILDEWFEEIEEELCVDDDPVTKDYLDGVLRTIDNAIKILKKSEDIDDAISKLREVKFKIVNWGL